MEVKKKRGKKIHLEMKDVGSGFRGHRGPDPEARPPEGLTSPRGRGVSRIGFKRKAYSRDRGEGRRGFFCLLLLLKVRQRQQLGDPLALVEVKFEFK